MKKITTIVLVLLFASSFAQTTGTKKTVAKPKTTTKSSTIKSSTKKPMLKSTTIAAPKASTKHVTTTAPAPKPAPQPQTPPRTQPEPVARPVIQQPAPQPVPQTQSQPAHVSQSKIESIWIGGSVGGGLAVSTNIINSGAVFPANLELLFQTRHHRYGIGFANELYITPEALGRLALGEAPVVHKLYFSYEAFIFRNFPINLGFSSHIGFFGTNGSHTLQQKSGTIDTATARGGMFGNIGAVLEIGARPFYFFVRPSIEYKSWSGWHKEIMATGSIGVRLKFLTDYEIKRRSDKKRDRDHKY